MSKIFFCFFILLASCSNLLPKKNKEILHPSLDTLKVSEKRHWVLKNGENLARNVSVVTLAAWVRPKKNSKYPMDLIAVSVAGKENPSNASRASIRLLENGKIGGIARALDAEAAQRGFSSAVVQESIWQHIVLVIDYEKNRMEFYKNGVFVPSTGRIRFKARKTSDTPSKTIVIGAEDDGSAYHFNGDVKHVGIWGRRLYQDEIKKLVEQFSNDFKLR
jgi:Concanavalin A-like lectin/glucanases superfamily